MKSFTSCSINCSDGRSCLLDYADLSKRKVIEFDGSYWHTDADKESERDRRIMNEGYSILHIREADFIQDPESVVEACIEFLNSPENPTMTLFVG